MIRRLANMAALGIGSAALVMVGIAPAVTPATAAPGAPATARQPYGGCKEAYTAPRSEGARWCAFRHFRRWQPVSRELADALAEGGSRGATTRKWERCAVRYGRTTIVVCPDGHVETS